MTGDKQQQQQQQKHSVGRGGSGNFTNQQSPSLTATDLETPAIKSDKYTTGRGGAGNIQVNRDPEAARAAQDITPIPRRESNSTPIGRGGAGNVIRPGKQGPENAIEDGAGSPRASGEHSRSKSFLDKVKEKVHLDKKDKKESSNSPPAA